MHKQLKDIPSLNNKLIYFLRFPDENQNKMQVDTIVIHEDLFDDFKHIIDDYINKNKYSWQDWIDIITIFSSKELRNPTILEQMNYYTNKKNSNIYCKNFEKPYQKIEFNTLDNIQTSLPLGNDIQKHEGNEEINRLIKNYIYTACDDLQYLIDIESFLHYEGASELIPSIKVCAHRRVGWKVPEKKLNDHLSVRFDTNFGYGQKSYFYVMLIYKGVEIIPFADFIHYREGFEIKLYTKRYKPSYNNWNDAMTFVAESYNILVENEYKFIEQFLINEIKKLVENLKSISTKKSFYFYQSGYNNSNEDIQYTELSGYELIEFRANKITSALDLIEVIEKYNNFIDIEDAILQIKLFNKELLPVLENKTKIINADILKVKNLEIQLSNKLKEDDIIHHSYEQKKDEIKFENKLSKIDFESLFKKNNPEYEDFYKTYHILRDNHQKTTKQLNELNHYYVLLNMYQEKVITYFDVIKSEK